METATVKYLGGLRCEAVHMRSGQELLTDAPPDNQGRGEAFSPTDLLCTSLACCMLTLMGIAARERDIAIEGTTAKVVKHMASGPRRVARIKVLVTLMSRTLEPKEKAVLEHAARTCPVSLSLHPEVEQDMEFLYVEMRERGPEI